MAEIAKPEAQHKEVVGEVVSDKMEKTIVVRVARRVRHPRYHKIMTKYKKFYAHDEKSEAGMGDQVRIVSSRPTYGANTAGLWNTTSGLSAAVNATRSPASTASRNWGVIRSSRTRLEPAETARGAETGRAVVAYDAGAQVVPAAEPVRPADDVT